MQTPAKVIRETPWVQATAPWVVQKKGQIGCSRKHRGAAYPLPHLTPWRQHLAVRLPLGNVLTLLHKAHCHQTIPQPQEAAYVWIGRHKQKEARVSVEMSRWVGTASHLCVCSHDMWSCQEKPSDRHVSRAEVDRVEPTRPIKLSWQEVGLCLIQG